MLIFGDNRPALAHILEVETPAEKERLLDAAVATVPRTQDEFTAAAELLRFLVETASPATRAKAIYLATATYELISAGRLNGELLHHLRELMPLFDMVSDPPTAICVLSMIEAFRPRSLS